MQDFWPRINILKGILFLKNLSINYGSSKSDKIVFSKSIFDVKNQLNFFKKNQAQAKYFVQKIRWLKPKPINKKLRLRPINRLIGRPLLFWSVGTRHTRPHLISTENFIQDACCTHSPSRLSKTRRKNFQTGFEVGFLQQKS